MHTRDIELTSGASVRAYLSHADDSRLFPIMYHHGTPNIGEPPAPLIDVAERMGFRWVGLDRPGYGGSARRVGRDIASVAQDALEVADALGLQRFAVFGHSGGGPHALATAALAPDRVAAAVSVAGLAPYSAQGLDWFHGMVGPGSGELTAAMRGGDALRAHLESSEFDPEMFTPEDHDALQNDWAWFNEVVTQGVANGLDGMVDDDVAYVSDWGVEPSDVAVPALIMHGTADRVVPYDHGMWLAEHIHGAALHAVTGAGHISVVRESVTALTWLSHHAR
jgi:pimeloyl-ACP methyl ester carboxylesterase